MKVDKKLLIGLLSLGVITASCGRHPGGEQIEERSQATPEGTWEIAWVDPQIVLSDSLFTLIRSERLDSFPVTKPNPTAAAPSIVFTITSASCPVTVNLMNSRDMIVSPLLMQTLKPGHYKLTLDFSHFNYVHFPRGQYRLKANSCGLNRTVYVNRD